MAWDESRAWKRGRHNQKLYQANAQSPIFAELHTTLADQTPMTARGGVPFPDQIDRLRARLLQGAA